VACFEQKHEEIYQSLPCCAVPEGRYHHGIGDTSSGSIDEIQLFPTPPMVDSVWLAAISGYMDHIRPAGMAFFRDFAGQLADRNRLMWLASPAGVYFVVIRTPEKEQSIESGDHEPELTGKT